MVRASLGGMLSPVKRLPAESFLSMHYLMASYWQNASNLTPVQSSQSGAWNMQVGIDSFAAAFTEDSRAIRPSERLRNLVEQIEHADQVGLDSFGVGEHHRA